MRKSVAAVALTAFVGTTMLVSGAQFAGAATLGTEFTSMSPAAGSTFDGNQANEQFGSSVAVSGDGQVMAVGAKLSDVGGTLNTGRVEVYLRNGDTWTQMPSIFSGSFANDEFGYSLSLNEDGTYLAVGSRRTFFSGQTGYGIIDVYKRTGSSWASYGAPIRGRASTEMFGVDVALSQDGQTLIGAGLGYSAVYRYDVGASAYSQIGTDLSASQNTGMRVDISDTGSKVVVSHDQYDSGALTDAGRVQTFEWNGAAWTQIGSDLVGGNASDQFGSDVAMSGDGSLLVVGARNQDVTGSNNGAATVYRFVSGSWNQVGATIAGTEVDELLGNVVGMSRDGSLFAVQGLNSDSSNAVNSGAVRVFSVIGDTIAQYGTDIPGPSATSKVGSSIGFDRSGRTIATGVAGVASGVGSVYVFSNPGPLSTDASLSAITLSSGEISFSQDVTSYSTSVRNNVKTISVTPVVTDSRSTITVNGAALSAGSAATVPLKLRTNVITIVVTAQNGNSNTYTVTVNRLYHRLKVAKKMTIKKAMTTVDKRVPAGAKVRVVVSKSSRTRCSATSTRLTALKKTGTCVLSVYVTPKATSKVNKPKTTKTTVRVTIYR